MDHTTPAPSGAPGERSALPVPLQFHLPELRLDSAAAYLAYCREHGLPERLDKSLRTLRREAEAVRRRSATAAMARGRWRQRPLRTLRQIAEDALDPAVLNGTLYKHAAHAVAALPRKDGTRAAFARSLRLLGKRADFLLEPRHMDRHWHPYIHIILHAHRLRRAWLRPIEAWNRRTRDPGVACRDLLWHLFQHYPTPPSLWNAWFRRDAAGVTYRDWFVRAGRGESLRNRMGPIRMSRRVAHYFSEAPVGITIERAIRWSQARALGVEPWLAETFARTQAGERFDQDPFWTDVLRWLAMNPPRRNEDIHAFVNYLGRQRFVEQEIVQPDGTRTTAPPPQPNLTMRGRTIESIHREIAREGRARQQAAVIHETWKPSGVRGFTWTRDGEPRTRVTWTLREITTLADLTQEGRSMRHCVVDYADWCTEGRSSIWTLSRSVGTRAERMQTLEVNNRTKAIDQCLGRFNREPSEEIRWVVRRWARREGLTLPKGF